MTDFLGNLTSAVVGPCANLWIGEPGMSSYPPIDVPPPQITDAVVKRDEEVAYMAQDKFIKSLSVSETSPPDADVLLKTQVLDLMENVCLIVLFGRLVLVGLDCSNVRGLCLH